MPWPATETLQRVKLTLEVLLLIVLIPVTLYILAKDRAAGVKLGMAIK